MGFVKKHPTIFAIVALFLVTIPSTVDAWWSLAEKIRGIAMPSLDLGIMSWIFPLIGIVLFIYTIRQIGKVVPQIIIQQNAPDRLLEIAEKQRDNPVTHLVITDRIWFEFKREAKLPFIWVRIYYKNLGVNDLMITLPEGYAYYNSERLPDRIVAQEGRQNVPASGGIGQFDLHIYIPIGFRDDVCIEVDNLPRREIRNLQLHEISSKVYIKGDDTRCVKWSLGGERVIFRPNG